MNPASPAQPSPSSPTPVLSSRQRLARMGASPASRRQLARSRRRSRLGFTLTEVLLASALGALLLTSLAITTFTAMANVTFLEYKAGLKSSADRVLRQITRDIREAWWAEVPTPARLRLSYPDGRITEYALNSGNLTVLRPDGSQGTILDSIESLAFEATLSPRHRDGAPVTVQDAWYQVSTPASPPLALEVPVGGLLTLAFAVPVSEQGLPQAPAGDEHLLGAYSNVLSVPVAWIPGSSPTDLTVALHESRGPGSGVPYGAALATTALPGSALPAAVWNGLAYDPPAATVAISLASFGVYLEPGRGYVLMLQADGDAGLVAAGHPVAPGTDKDDVCVKGPLAGDGYIVQPLVVPTSVAGSYWTTATIVSDAVSRVTINLQQSGQPTIIRSAALLSQAISDDPWLGVVPGESPP